MTNTDNINATNIASTSKTELLEQLQAADIISAEQQQAALKLQQHETEQTAKTPWFVNVLQGLGAWFSAIMFIIFFAVTGIFNGIVIFIPVGIVLVVTALIASFKITNKSSYVAQLLFAASLTGHVLLAAGIAIWGGGLLPAALTMMVVSVLCILFYAYHVHKFLSVHVLLSSLLVLMYEIGVGVSAIAILMVSVTLLNCWLWLNESRYIVDSKRYIVDSKRYALFRPIQYALLSTLFLDAMTIDNAPDLIIDESTSFLLTLPFHEMIAIGFFCGFVWLIQHIFQRLQLDQQGKAMIKWGLIALMFVLCVLFYYSPSILAALFILLLGIERHNRIIVASAVVALIYAIGQYYYWLELTLLHKSLLLMGSGLLLLVAGIIPYRQGQKQRKTTEAG